MPQNVIYHVVFQHYHILIVLVREYEDVSKYIYIYIYCNKSMNSFFLNQNLATDNVVLKSPLSQNEKNI